MNEGYLLIDMVVKGLLIGLIGFCVILVLVDVPVDGPEKNWNMQPL